MIKPTMVRKYYLDDFLQTAKYLKWFSFPITNNRKNDEKYSKERNQKQYSLQVQ
jgi:hypothetical protein